MFAQDVVAESPTNFSPVVSLKDTYTKSALRRRATERASRSRSALSCMETTCLYSIYIIVRDQFIYTRTCGARLIEIRIWIL